MGRFRFGRWAAGVAVAVAVSQAAIAAAGQDTLPPDDVAERLKAAREVIATFNERFKADIMSSVKQDGVVAAVGNYHTNIPEVSSRLAGETPFEIGRTALRLRNQENAPDAWEQATLEKFASQIAAGADPTKLEATLVATTDEGQKIFRVMTPIMMHDTCLACHGANVRQDVKQEIAKYYPDDKALGYALGEMRGAFSLVQQLE